MTPGNNDDPGRLRRSRPSNHGPQTPVIGRGGGWWCVVVSLPLPPRECGSMVGKRARSNESASEGGLSASAGDVCLRSTGGQRGCTGFGLPPLRFDSIRVDIDRSIDRVESISSVPGWRPKQEEEERRREDASRCRRRLLRRAPGPRSLFDLLPQVVCGPHLCNLGGGAALVHFWVSICNPMTTIRTCDGNDFKPSTGAPCWCLHRMPDPRSAFAQRNTTYSFRNARSGSSPIPTEQDHMACGTRSTQRESLMAGSWNIGSRAWQSRPHHGRPIDSKRARPVRHGRCGRVRAAGASVRRAERLGLECKLDSLKPVLWPSDPHLTI